MSVATCGVGMLYLYCPLSLSFQIIFRNFSFCRHSSHIYRASNKRSTREAVHGSSVSLGSKSLLSHGKAYSQFFSRRDVIEEKRQNQVCTLSLPCISVS